MKLILEAIKSLFRKVENAISQTTSTLSKRINNIEAKVKKAQATANEANAAVDELKADPWKLAGSILIGGTGTHEFTVPKFNKLKVVGGLKNSNTSLKGCVLKLNGYQLCDALCVCSSNWGTIRYQLEVEPNGVAVGYSMSAKLFGSNQTVSVVTYTGSKVNASRIVSTNTLTIAINENVTVTDSPLSVYYC